MEKEMYSSEAKEVMRNLWRAAMDASSYYPDEEMFDISSYEDDLFGEISNVINSLQNVYGDELVKEN